MLIFDEPFSGFDPVNAEMLKREILALRDKGHTVIFSTHNMSSVEEVCDEIALINRSRLVLSGHVDEVRERFRTGLYEVTATGGSLAGRPELYDILERTEAGGLATYLLRKREGVGNSALATAVAADVELRSFSERLPSMQEIFIKVVGDNVPED